MECSDCDGVPVNTGLGTWVHDEGTLTRLHSGGDYEGAACRGQHTQGCTLQVTLFLL